MVLKKDKICELEHHIDEMKICVIRHFDSVQDLINEMLLVFNDKVSDKASLEARFKEVVSKR